MKARGSRWLLAGLALFLSAATRLGAQDHPDFLVERDVMIPARDGIMLATDIYRPARNGVTVTGSFPVLLQRTPYGKNSGRKGW